MKTVNLCVFGDSISYGAWDASGGWVDRLRSHLHGLTLASRFQSYYFAYHLGIPGNTIGDVLLRLPYEAKAREPHVIIFAIGINDARWRVPGQIPHVDEDTFRHNIEKLIAEGRRFTQIIVFVGLTAVDETKTMPFDPALEVGKSVPIPQKLQAQPINRKPFQNQARITAMADFKSGVDPECYFENERIRGYDAIIRELTTTANIPYLPVYDALSPAEDMEDGLHPNARGHEKLFLLVRDFLTAHSLL